MFIFIQQFFLGGRQPRGRNMAQLAVDIDCRRKSDLMQLCARIGYTPHGFLQA